MLDISWTQECSRLCFYFPQEKRSKHTKPNWVLFRVLCFVCFENKGAKQTLMCGGIWTFWTICTGAIGAASEANARRPGKDRVPGRKRCSKGRRTGTEPELSARFLQKTLAPLTGSGSGENLRWGCTCLADVDVDADVDFEAEEFARMEQGAVGVSFSWSFVWQFSKVFLSTFPVWSSNIIRWFPYAMVEGMHKVTGSHWDVTTTTQDWHIKPLYFTCQKIGKNWFKLLEATLNLDILETWLESLLWKLEWNVSFLFKFAMFLDRLKKKRGLFRWPYLVTSARGII